MLPFRINGRTIYPTLYTRTSEELKAVLPLGYKILTIHKYIRYSKIFIFNDYINTMYKIKMNSTKDG